MGCDNLLEETTMALNEGLLALMLSTEEAKASQEAIETPIVPEDHSTDQVPLVSSDRPPSLLEEASDTQSENLASSLESHRPDIPQPTLDDTRATSPVQFPEEAEASQEVIKTPIFSEDHSPEQAPLLSSDWSSSPLEEASDTQSENLASSLAVHRPDTPQPTLDDARATSPVQFPVANEPEVQGYSTQVDDGRVAQTETHGLGNHVHLGGVETQPAYTRPQENERRREEMPSPLFLPVPSPAEPRRGLCAEHAAWLATKRRPALPTPQRANHKLEPGIYTATNLPSLDLSGADNRSLTAFEPHAHGSGNQHVSAALRLKLPFSRRLILPLYSGSSSLVVLVTSLRESALGCSSL